ncbi:hypothetical protein Leryth_021736 [Lithospermum erythrorhizon]|nr:hypothetical protein Leryth_021736 [Lithospermum erythrorhizon]
MSRSSRHRTKNGHRSGLTQDLFDDETSARTRPLSFDEVMLRRNNRKETAGDDIGSEEAHGLSKRHDVEVASKPAERKTATHIDSIPSGMSRALEESQRVKTSKKEHASCQEDRLVRNAVDDRNKTGPARVTLRSKIVSNGKTLEGKNDRYTHIDKAKDEYLRDDLKTKKDKRHSETSVQKHRSGERIRGKYEEHKSHKQAGENDERLQNRRKKDDQLKKDLEHMSQKRDSIDLTGADIYVDKSRVKSEKETRRKHHIDEERVREAQRSMKHDAGKRKYTDSSERKERVSARSHHEESKRRRPSSREPDKDIVGRHSSQNTHKGSSHYRNSAVHSPKDMPGGLHTDTEKASTDGTNSHHRRHGVSSSGLGGYSPRKRKSDSATRTPSPLRRSPETRTIGWDLNPTVNGRSSTGGLVPSHSEPSSNQDLPYIISATLATAKPAIGILDHTRPLNVGAVDSIQLTQATRPMRRLYVENLPGSASEKAVMEWINSSLLFSGVNHIQGTQPCISCVMNKEKGQALLEFLTPEVASIAISLDGRSFSGSILKLRRPKDFSHVFVFRQLLFSCRLVIWRNRWSWAIQ